MAKRLLMNRKTGVKFPYSKRLLKNNDNVVEVDASGDDPIDEVDATGETESAYKGDSIIIEKATKSELIDFAGEHYGAQLAKRDSIEDLRAQVRELIEADGQ